MSTKDIAVELATLPEQVRGFGHVKAASAEAAAMRRAELLEAFAAGGWPRRAHAAE